MHTPLVSDDLPGAVQVAVDGEADDWLGRTVLDMDPVGDAEPGFLDLGSGFAFANEHALYLLIETVPGVDEINSFEIDLQLDSRVVRVLWGPGWDFAVVADVTNEWLSLGNAPNSSFALESAFEARIDFRDLGEHSALAVLKAEVMVGECCESPGWRSADTWEAAGSVSFIDAPDPAWRLASAGGARELDRIEKAPDQRRVTLAYDATTRQVRVTGEAGAVPEGARVLVMALELGDLISLQADATGGFETAVAGAPGVHILVKQDVTNHNFELPDRLYEFNENVISPGIVLRVPGAHGGDDPRRVEFNGGARLCCTDGNQVAWTIDGAFDRQSLESSGRFSVSGTLTLWSDPRTTPPEDFLNLSVVMLADASGRQVGRSGKFISTFLTPTGLPIERSLRGQPVGHIEIAEMPIDGWSLERGRWTAQLVGNADVPDDLPDGTYSLMASGLWQSVNAGLQPTGLRESATTVRDDQMYAATLGTFAVGSPSTVRLAAALFSDTLSEGSRGGIIAREDAGAFDISSRAVTRHDPVLSRIDGYGDPWTYRLEPYLPFIDAIDRTFPAPPAVDFNLSQSELVIFVERPDGAIEQLGPAPFGQYTVKSPRTPWNDGVGLGGGELREVPQLQGHDGVFAYQFPTDGDYVVTVNGHVAGLDGRRYEICGSYDVTVGHVLDIETSLLPGTPFEVGDTVGPTLMTMPGVPADVTYRVTLVSADGTTTAETFTGTANSHGYWDGDDSRFTFDRDGEYAVEIEARYEAPDGRLWAGRMRFGSVVATPNAPIIAHGRRGPDNQEEVSPPWAFESAFVMEESDHMQFPYFTGDILWGVTASDAGDAVVPHTSIQPLDDDDPLLSRVIEQFRRWSNHNSEQSGANIRAGQVTLITGPETQAGGVGSTPADVSLWAYMYSHAERPGVRVREIIQGDDISGSYWRFGDPYHVQSGNGRPGDLPGDFKFLYGGAVIRDAATDEGIYAIYGSGWIHATDDDPLGSRFMPPFQGAAGGPDGGPLFEVHGREVDMFFIPMAVRPGTVLEVGDTFRMAGPIMPTLPSLVEYTVTAPDGTVRRAGGRANAVGYFYDPADDFVLDQAGEWTVHLTVTHDGMTSAGLVEPPYPAGGVLSPDGHTFRFVVTNSNTASLEIVTDLSELTPDEWWQYARVQGADFSAALPAGWNGDTAWVTVTMPGILLVDQEISIVEGTVAWRLDGWAMSEIADNFDVEEGLADTVVVTFHADGQVDGVQAQADGSIVVHGARVPQSPD